MSIEVIKKTVIGTLSVAVISSGMIVAITTASNAGNGSHYDEDPPSSISDLMDEQEDKYLERKYQRQCPQLKQKCNRGSNWACKTHDEYCDD